MREIIISKGHVALVDDEDYDNIIHPKWYRTISKYGVYADRARWDSLLHKYIRERMHRVIMNAPKGLQIDHINHNTLDNRKSNLRIVTGTYNLANQRNIKGGTSKFKGVVWHKKGKKWMARIGKHGLYEYLGLFVNEIDAAIAYNTAAIRLYGEFAFLNPIEHPHDASI
jgi:hypothetical protein